MPEIQPHRETEGSKKGVASHARNPESRGRRPGRPPGSKNKPKTLLPKELADEILIRMKDMLPPEHYDYLRGVVREGKAVSLEHELDVLILILSRNLVPAIVEETIPKENVQVDPETGELVSVPGLPFFRKDVTERLKVLNSLLSLKHQVDKRAEPDSTEKPIFEIFARRGIDGDRIKFLLGVEHSAMAGNSDGVEWGTDSPRAISDSVAERPIEVQGSDEVPPVGDIDNSIGGDAGDSGYAP